MFFIISKGWQQANEKGFCYPILIPTKQIYSHPNIQTQYQNFCLIPIPPNNEYILVPILVFIFLPLWY